MGMLLTYHPGYRGEADAEDTEVTDRPLDRQNKAQLQETAAGLGLDAEGTKGELRERIAAHLEPADPADPDAGEPDGEPEAEGGDADPDAGDADTDQSPEG